MTLRELLEQSNLAALGLLDNEDHAQYERALAQAPEHIRRQVIQDQARWASGGVLLPDAAAPAALKARVLDSVHAAIVDASISADDFSLLRTGKGAMSLQGLEASLGGRKVAAGWRAASVALMAAVVALGGAFLYVYQNSVQSTQGIAENELLTNYASNFGTNFDDVVFDPATRHTILASADEAFTGRVAVYANADWNSSRLIASNLPRVDNARYVVVELDAQGNVARELTVLEGGRQAQAATLPKLAPGTMLAVLQVGINERAGSQPRLMTGTVA